MNELSPRLKESLLRAVSHFANNIEEDESNLVESVDQARQAGCSWDDVAGALGITRQGAMRKFAQHVTHVDLRKAEA